MSPGDRVRAVGYRAASADEIGWRGYAFQLGAVSFSQ